ncbi:MAG: hypothetical protein DRH24_17210 [Deltaproteobacteria bacterium]|nr:MAG: hypothetical protein DRH24_17210 [Deltaproteobacteria bacterium]
MDKRSKLMDDLRAFVREKGDISPEERREVETLLDYAERGDYLALAQARSLAAKGGYEPPPGLSGPLPPGPLMVCPKDPEHYAVYATEEDEELFCPEHQVRLVPAPSEE